MPSSDYETRNCSQHSSAVAAEAWVAWVPPVLQPQTRTVPSMLLENSLSDPSGVATPVTALAWPLSRATPQKPSPTHQRASSPPTQRRLGWVAEPGARHPAAALLTTTTAPDQEEA